MRTVVALALVIAAVSAGAAQLYRWVDEKGNVEWRDTPPPANAKSVEQRNIRSNTIDTSNMPFSVQRAMKDHPVTLWIFDCGKMCVDARSHLARRGIPHTERNAQANQEELKKATGSLEAPVLIVGSTQLKGYSESQWDGALDAAGYPRTPIPGVKPQVKADAKDVKAPAK